MIIDEIQESAAIYNRIRGFTRQLKSDFIITGSYLGRILNREFKYSAGDLDSLEIHTNNVRMTFDEWFNRWMEEYKKNQVKIGTYLNYQKYYAGMIKGAIGQKQINSIRGDDIQKIYNSWVKKEYAISTIKIASAVLNGCFKQAEKNGLIERNPVKLATLPRKEKRSKKMKVLTKNQQILFMEYAKQSYLYNLFAVMLRTGMRSGEARGLIYGLDIDKKNW